MAETGVPSSSAVRVAESISAMRPTLRRCAWRAAMLCCAPLPPMNCLPGAPRRNAASCCATAFFAEPGRFFLMPLKLGAERHGRERPGVSLVSPACSEPRAMLKNAPVSRRSADIAQSVEQLIRNQ